MYRSARTHPPELPLRRDDDAPALDFARLEALPETFERLEVDALAGLGDGAGDLVTEHLGLDERQVAVHDVQVGATDPAGGHLDEQLARTDGGLR